MDPDKAVNSINAVPPREREPCKDPSRDNNTPLSRTVFSFPFLLLLDETLAVVERRGMLTARGHGVIRGSRI